MIEIRSETPKADVTYGLPNLVLGVATYGGEEDWVVYREDKSYRVVNKYSYGGIGKLDDVTGMYVEKEWTNFRPVLAVVVK